MRIGLATWVLGVRTLNESIEKAIECGCRAISFHLTPQEHQRPGEAERIFDLVAHHDLDVTCHSTLGPLNGTDPFQRLQDEVDAIIEWHSVSRRVRCVSYDPATTVLQMGEGPVFDLEKTIERLKYVSDRFGRRGIKTALENWLVNSRLEDFEAVKDGVGDGNLGALLDIGHLNIAVRRNLTRGLSAAEFVRRLPLPFYEIHLHYNNGRDDQHAPLEAHSILVEQAVQALAERGFDGIATVEHGGEPIPETLKAIRKSMKIFGKLFTSYHKDAQ
jgi:sugar phosphate isomerase/epimerase